jgi:hypothetical protein
MSRREQAPGRTFGRHANATTSSGLRYLHNTFRESLGSNRLGQVKLIAGAVIMVAAVNRTAYTAARSSGVVTVEGSIAAAAPTPAAPPATPSPHPPGAVTRGPRRHRTDGTSGRTGPTRPDVPSERPVHMAAAPGRAAFTGIRDDLTVSRRDIPADGQTEPPAGCRRAVEYADRPPIAGDRGPDRITGVPTSCLRSRRSGGGFGEVVGEAAGLVGVDRDAGAHRGGERDLPQVPALGCGGLEPDHLVDGGRVVLKQGRGRE